MIYDEDIFEGNWEHAIAVIWWLLHLQGGKVAFPITEDFWEQNFPPGTRLAMKVENGTLVLVSEQMAHVPELN